jgi:hypothetical protein
MTLFEHVGTFMVTKLTWEFNNIGLGFTLFNDSHLDIMLLEVVFLNFHLYITNK